MQGDKIKLLIVDDEEQFLNSIQRSLELRDFQVVTVNRGEEALRVARQQPIDIALVDLKMPGMDGQETLEALKNEHHWMEIVILTGHGSIDSAAACSRSGAIAYLQKPCELEDLLQVLINAYKRVVMNRQKIEEQKMESMLRLSMSNSPREILKKLREIDQEENALME